MARSHGRPRAQHAAGSGEDSGVGRMWFRLGLALLSPR
jgi:hypothetical protein